MKSFKFLLAILASFLVSFSAFAVVDPSITDAVTNASLKTTTIATGVVTIAAVFMGLGLVVAWLRK